MGFPAVFAQCFHGLHSHIDSISHVYVFFSPPHTLPFSLSLFFFCVLFTDYEKVITHSIHQSNYEEALHVLTSKALDVLALDISDKDKKARFSSFANLYYRFSPILVKKCAERTVEAWIKMDRFLEAKRLIPALIQCNQSADSKQVKGDHQTSSHQRVISRF